MRTEIATPAGAAVVEIDRPTGGEARALLVLTHGAAGGVHAPDLLAVRAAAVPAGIVVALLTQPYRVAGRRSPPAPAPQDEAWIAAVAAIRRRRGLRTLPLITGGRSNGARVACRTAAASNAVGVVALAFPVHRPHRHETRRPATSRLPELDAAGVAVLVVQGDRDPFGMPPPGAHRQIVVVPGADHALRRDTAGTATAVVAFVTSLTAHARVER